MNRREFLKIAGAAGALPLFNIGCAGFGRWSGLEVEEVRIVREFLGAVHGNPGAINTGLDFSIPLAKTLMLSNALAFAGKGSYGWDAKANRTTSETANAHLRHGYRKGWEIA